MSDTPAPDRTARAMAENVYAAFCRQARMPHPFREEQTILARLAEAIRPQIGTGSPGDIIAAANVVLDEWERRDPDVRGPRVVSANQIDATVTVG
ncbi:hypothetical protein [Methylobacterium sp. J-076]|uniref:hypothetical protein n=1 Tax=Methylobacterium sp. J-076 TaxID=2836655 RepID=UPI001FB9D3EC|nr:hypothetical protein [Methylobacterium sp. J-076]MCJ2011757.1 hypothetical protein [Methylobacterium sp. J-076]